MVHKSRAKLLNAAEELGTPPNEEELQRLIEYYDTYSLEHRLGLLRGYLEGKSVEDLVKAKLKAKFIIQPLTKQQKGAHTKWVIDKVKRTIVRLLFLRYTLDDGMTQQQARSLLNKDYGSYKKTKAGDDAGASNIERMTRSKIFRKKHPDKLSRKMVYKSK